MYKDIADINKAIGFESMEDFFPPPEKLVRKTENVRITISLSKESIDFFKKSAKKNKCHYQAMIRSVLDNYKDYYAN